MDDSITMLRDKVASDDVGVIVVPEVHRVTVTTGHEQVVVDDVVLGYRAGGTRKGIVARDIDGVKVSVSSGMHEAVTLEQRVFSFTGFDRPHVAEDGAIYHLLPT